MTVDSPHMASSPRTPVQVEAGRVRIGDVEQPVADPTDPEQVYGAYLSVLYAVRGARRGERLPLRTADLEALLLIVGDDPDTIEQRLVALMGCTPEEASALRGVLLRHRRLTASLGVVAVLGLGGAAVASSATSDPAPAPADTTSSSALGSLAETDQAWSEPEAPAAPPTVSGPQAALVEADEPEPSPFVEDTGLSPTSTTSSPFAPVQTVVVVAPTAGPVAPPAAAPAPAPTAEPAPPAVEPAPTPSPVSPSPVAPEPPVVVEPTPPAPSPTSVYQPYYPGPLYGEEPVFPTPDPEPDVPGTELPDPPTGIGGADEPDLQELPPADAESGIGEALLEQTLDDLVAREPEPDVSAPADAG